MQHNNVRENKDLAEVYINNLGEFIQPDRHLGHMNYLTMEVTGDRVPKAMKPTSKANKPDTTAGRKNSTKNICNKGRNDGIFLTLLPQSCNQISPTLCNSFIKHQHHL